MEAEEEAEDMYRVPRISHRSRALLRLLWARGEQEVRVSLRTTSIQMILPGTLGRPAEHPLLVLSPSHTEGGAATGRDMMKIAVVIVEV